MKASKIKMAVTLVISLLICALVLGEDIKIVQAGQLPSNVGIGTQPVGGAYHAVGSGVAALISKKTKIRAVVQPFGGSNAFVPLIQSGELEMGVMSGFDAGASYQGRFGYEKPYTNLRLVLRGNLNSAIPCTVLKSSGINKITELKGKKVGSHYGANQMIHNLVEAMLKSVGMTWKDVVPVGVPDFSSSIRMIQSGRVDCGSAGGVTTPAAVELHTGLGVNVLAFGDMQPSDIANGVPPEKQAVLDDLLPGSFPMVVKAGVGVLEKDTVIITFPIYLVASAKMPSDAVHTILGTIWDNYSDLHKGHPWLKEWKPQTMAAGNQPAPYHEGAIRFYKEKGVWTAAMEKRQNKIMK